MPVVIFLFFHETASSLRYNNREDLEKYCLYIVVILKRGFGGRVK